MHSNIRSKEYYTQQSRGDDSHLKTITRLAKIHLLIIDDLLLTYPTDSERRNLLEIVEDRYQSGATAITSQCPISDWHPNIGDPTLADAICDRLFHNAYGIELRGDSMRKDQDGHTATPAESEKNGKGGKLAAETSLC
jgi:DNA replication protein DnaC